MASPTTSASDLREPDDRTLYIPAPRSRATWIVPLVAAAFVGLIVLLYYVSVHAAAPNSDGATVVLEGRSLASGHLTLKGWRLSHDSFWTVDALFYAVAVLITGIRPVLLQLVPAVLAALVIVVGALMARDVRPGRAGWAGAATVVALLGLPTHAFAQFFLLGPLHVGTTLYCLLAFLGLRRAPATWRIPLVAIILAAGMLGDLQTVAIGVVPVFVGGLVAMLRCRSWRAGFDAVVAAVAAVVLAEVARAVAKAFGTYTVGSSQRAKGHQITLNIEHVWHYAAQLILGTGTGSLGGGGVPHHLAAAHFVGLALIIAAGLVALGSLLYGVVTGRSGTGRRDGRHRSTARAETARRETWRLDDFLLIGIVGDLVLFVELTLQSNNTQFARYLTPGVIFAAVLAGRLVARVCSALPGWSLMVLALPAAVVIACSGAAVGYDVAAAAPVQPQSPITHFLATHDLHRGVGDYWTSSIVTVETRGKVAVRPVVADTAGRIVGYGRQSPTSWYEGQTFNFLVFNAGSPFAGVDYAAAAATFGRPPHLYFVDSWRVLVWSHPITVPAGP
jgi:hypothetical protein